VRTYVLSTNVATPNVETWLKYQFLFLQFNIIQYYPCRLVRNVVKPNSHTTVGYIVAFLLTVSEQQLATWI